MLYSLFEYLNNNYDIAGTGVFQYLSFRAGMAALFSLIISILFGKKIISILTDFQLSEKIRDLDLNGQKEKKGTPTMGGLIIVLSIIFPTLLFADLSNIYIIMMLIVTVFISLIGFIDDYLKIKNNNKDGLKGRFKIIGQILIGIFVSFILISNETVVVRNFTEPITQESLLRGVDHVDTKELITTIPFVKDNQFRYDWLLPSVLDDYTWAIYSLIIIFIITAVSNGANLTDGIDGLAAGVSAIIVFALAIFSFVSGNINFASYLNIMYIPYVGEIVVFISAFLGALIGFLWYNTYPAEIFMGDTGSLTIGAVISVIAIIVRKELLIPLLCGVFFIETLSVIMQVSYFKYTRTKTGIGQRIFKMAPLHHHFQKLGFHESKIVSRFWILGIILAVLTIVTLKLR